MGFDIGKEYIGGFSPNDGTIDFYLRVGSLLKPEHVVLDMGAGRAAWFEDDQCETRRAIRDVKGRVAKMIAADVDDAVFSNRSSDQQVLIVNGKVDLPDASCDVIFADYVLEHIQDAKEFVDEVGRLLKPGGWFCARTPHKYSYVATVSRMIRNDRHAKVLNHVQPDRKEIDVFPALYRLNTLSHVASAFKGWENRSFIFTPDPAYYFNSKLLFKFQMALHRLMWKEFSGNLFVFVRKA